jgi:hypothetical protein
VSTDRFLVGTGEAGGGARQQQHWTAVLLNQPFGRALVVAAGVGVLCTGLHAGYRAVSGRFRKRLKNQEIDPSVDRWVDRVAAVGLVGRMAAFALVGIFLVKSAVELDAAESAGLDGALKRLGQSTWGDLVIVAVGVGLVAFGLYSCIEARYRRVLED